MQNKGERETENTKDQNQYACDWRETKESKTDSLDKRQLLLLYPVHVRRQRRHKIRLPAPHIAKISLDHEIGKGGGVRPAPIIVARHCEGVGKHVNVLTTRHPVKVLRIDSPAGSSHGSDGGQSRPRPDDARTSVPLVLGGDRVAIARWRVV